MRPCGISPSFAFTMLLDFVLPSALRAHYTLSSVFQDGSERWPALAADPRQRASTYENVKKFTPVDTASSLRKALKKLTRLRHCCRCGISPRSTVGFGRVSTTITPLPATFQRTFDQPSIGRSLYRTLVQTSLASSP